MYVSKFICVDKIDYGFVKKIILNFEPKLKNIQY